MNSSVLSDWQSSCPTIQDANSKLLSSKKFSDVVFLVGENKVQVHAHKLILMSRSSVFETMFERWETGKNCQVEIPEISNRSFQFFLQYLYSNKFSAVTVNDAGEILYLAHKYNTTKLAKLCSDLLKSTMKTSNVVHIHQVAKMLDQEELRTHAMEFILKNGKAVLEDAQFFGMDFETLATLLNDDKLAVDELTVFRAVMRWAENKCNVQKLNCTGENKRAVLKHIVHLIRFPVMRPQDFTDEVVGKNKGILVDNEIIGIYMHFTTSGVSGTNTTMPELPFNKNKRGPVEIYKAEVYNSQMHQRIQSCRKGYYGNNSAYKCESTITFQSSRNICVTAIDLNELSFTDGYYTGSQLGNSMVILVSISLTHSCPDKVSAPHESANATQAQLRMENLLTTSSKKIEFDSGLDILKKTQYTIKISCTGGGDGSAVVKYAQSAALPTRSVKATDGIEKITLSFDSENTRCGSRNRGGGSSYSSYGSYTCQDCICSGLIKTIHFTL